MLEAALVWRMDLFEEVNHKAEREGFFEGMDDVEEEDEEEV